MNTPHGIRLCNPGNIRHSLTTRWIGQAPAQTDSEFVTFSDAKYGIRAIAKIMESYERIGINTIEAAISRWAPPIENNTTAYVKDVAKACGVDPKAEVSLKQIMPDLVKAIVMHENGEMPYSNSDIITGISLA